MAPSASTRARRFALPALDDERADEVIEAFLEGRQVRRGRKPAAKHTGAAPTAAAPVNAVAPTDPAAATDATAPEDSSAAADAVAAAVNTSAVTEMPAEDAAEARVPAVQALAALRVAGSRPVGDLRSMPGRLEWTAALERESLRASRYARPAAVAIIELRPLRGSADDDPWLKTLAAPVARVLRRDSRSTDVVARVASGRFQVLLPETSAAGADQYAERIGATCRSEVGATGAAVTVRICVAAVTRGRSLTDAVEEALRSIAAA